jgi:hypothetical protein
MSIDVVYTVTSHASERKRIAASACCASVKEIAKLAHQDYVWSQSPQRSNQIGENDPRSIQAVDLIHGHAHLPHSGLVVASRPQVKKTDINPALHEGSRHVNGLLFGPPKIQG